MATFDRDPDLAASFERFASHRFLWPLILFSLPLYLEEAWTLWQGQLDAWSLLAHLLVLGAYAALLRHLLWRHAPPRRTALWGLLALGLAGTVFWRVFLGRLVSTFCLLFHLLFLGILGTVAFWLGVSEM